MSITSNRRETIIPMRKPAWIDHGTSQLDHLARRIPHHWRWFHRAYANVFGWFGLPCTLCGREFGAHKLGGYIVDPTHPDGGITLCSECSRKHPKLELR